MPEFRSDLERVAEQVAPPGDAFGRFLHRQKRSRLRRRLAAGVIGLGLGIGAVALVAQLVPLTRPPGAARWSRVPHDDQVFGGPGAQVMRSVVEVNGRLVAVGADYADLQSGAANPAVWLSDDGVRWRRLPDGAIGERTDGATPVVMWDVVAFPLDEPPRLVAVGGHGRFHDALVWISDDLGESWRQVPFHRALFAGLESEMWAVTWTGEELVAVGTALRQKQGTDKGFEAVPWVSRDGETWAQAEGIEGVEAALHMEDVASHNGRLVASGVDHRPLVWVSEDGRAWEGVDLDPVAFPAGTGLRGVIRAMNGFVAFGHVQGKGLDAALWSSPDGISWKRVPDPSGALGGPGDQSIADVAWDGDALVGIALEPRGFEEARLVAWIQGDGGGWRKVTVASSGVGTGGGSPTIVSGGPGLVVVGSVIGEGGTDAAVWLYNAAADDR